MFIVEYSWQLGDWPREKGLPSGVFHRVRKSQKDSHVAWILVALGGPQVKAESSQSWQDLDLLTLDIGLLLYLRTA